MPHSTANNAKAICGDIMKNKDKAPQVQARTDSDEQEFSTCSAYDCTGLIPAGITSESEAEAYEELYPYVTMPLQPNNQNNDFDVLSR